MQHRRKYILLTAAAMLTAHGLLAQDATEVATPEDEPEVIGDPAGGAFTPIGGGYPDTFPGFLEAALPYVQTLDTDRFYILMMPMSFTYDTEVLTTTDLLDNSLAIERRRNQLDQACEAVVAEAGLDLNCQVVVPPVYIREAAEDELVLDYFTDDLGAVYFVGGDQTFAMNILNGTPLEAALSDAFYRGVVMGGNSAGAAIESRVMIGGFTSEDLDVEDQFREGAVDLWTEEDRRGLPFGIRNAIIEQHFFQYARPGRLINAIVQDGVPRIGIGVDGFTGVVVEHDEIVRDPFGLYTVGILDAQSLAQPQRHLYYTYGLLHAENVLFHLNTAGDRLAYNLLSGDITRDSEVLYRTPSSISGGNAPDFAVLPEGAGTLMLFGEGGFVPLITPEGTDLLVIVTGYSTQEQANEIARLFTDSSATVIVPSGDEPLDVSGFDSIFVYCADPTLVNVALLEPVRDAWLAGVRVALFDAAVAFAGTHYVNQPPIDYDNDDDAVLEAHEQGALLPSGTAQAEGLGLLPYVFEPRLIDNNRWARLIALALDHDTVGIGLPAGSSLFFSAGTTSAGGRNSIVVFDLSDVERLNRDSYSFAGGLVSVYAPGDPVLLPADLRR